MRVRIVRLLLFAAGAAGIFVLVMMVGAQPLAAALARVAWWQFALICCLYGLNVAIDALGWQYTLAENRASFRKLFAARCASEASNALSVVAFIGGEAIKAWLIRVEVPYEESVPSLILAKTAEVLAQTLLFALGVAVAIATGLGGPTLLHTMKYLLLVQVTAVGGLIGVQLTAVIGRLGRVLSWVGLSASDQAQQLDAALQNFYRNDWRRFLLSTVLHFAGALLPIAEAFIILYSFQATPSLTLATVIEALWSGVRFVTFFVPGSLGSLEGANTAAFPALGLTASAGLAFTLIRRARQAVWIGCGIVVLVAMRLRANPSRPRAYRAAPSSAA